MSRSSANAFDGRFFAVSTWPTGAPICRQGEVDRPLGVDDVGELVRSIGRVVAVPIREAE